MCGNLPMLSFNLFSKSIFRDQIDFLKKEIKKTAP